MKQKYYVELNRQEWRLMMLSKRNYGYLEKMVVFDLSSRFKSKSTLFLLVVFCSITGILY